MPDSQLDTKSREPDTGPTRPGVYMRGSETVDSILKAALTVLIDEGAAAFTVRRIAAECGMKVGNVSYHFPRKEKLVHVLLDEIMTSYEEKLDVSVRQPGLSNEERLRVVIKMCLDDIGSKRTTRLFTELWALANHNDFIAERVKTFYQQVQQVLCVYIKALNPSLDEKEVHTLALLISTAMEGTTPFLGYEKPWRGSMPAITAISMKLFVDLVKNIEPGEIGHLVEEYETG